MKSAEEVKGEMRKTEAGQLLVRYGFEPYDTESAARRVAELASQEIHELRDAIERAHASLTWAFGEVKHVDVSTPEGANGVHAYAMPDCPICAKFQEAKASLAKLASLIKP